MIKRYKKDDKNRLDLVNEKIINSIFDIFSPLEKYHNYKLTGLSKIPHNTGFIIISNHSFLPYDMMFFIKAYYHKTGKLIRGVTDHTIFKIPILRTLFLQLGILDGTMENSIKILDNKFGLIIYPGGAKEAMKPSTEKYQLRWQGRYGFIKLAIDNNVPIIPIITKGNDDVFKVYFDGYTIKLADIPLPIFKGPKKSQITHIIKEPIYLNNKFSNEKEKLLYIRRTQRKIINIFDEELNS
jgi:1-acyl-sn-glycerol-3-phosphate acyltransferase